MIVTRLGKLRGRRLGQAYDSAYQGYSNADPSLNPTPVMPAAPSGCSTWDMLYGNLTGDYSGCIVNNQAVIQQVPINAAAAGYSPAVVAVTQQTASQQEAMVPSDVATIVASEQSGTPSWAWLALGGVTLFAIAELLK
jgi:hypothetical protein